MKKTNLVKTVIGIKDRVTQDKIIDKITDLDKNNTPQSGRTLILTPRQYDDILSSDKFLRIRKTTWVTIGEIYGMEVIIEL